MGMDGLSRVNYGYPPCRHADNADNKAPRPPSGLAAPATGLRPWWTLGAARHI